MFFGVKNNLNDTRIPLIKWDSPSNLLKPEIEKVLPDLRIGEMIPKSEMPRNVPILPYVAHPQAPDIPNLSLPLLLEHREHLMPLWGNFETGSIITNRKTLRSLTENQKEFQIQLRSVEYDSRLFYILNSKPQNFHTHKVDRVTAVVVDSNSEAEYTDYYYKKITVNGVDIHYTCEIDAFTNDLQPIEIKTLKDNGVYKIFHKIAYITAIQCYFADVQEVIVGFYNENLGVVKLKLFSTKTLENDAKQHGHDCEVAISQMETHLTEITSYMRNRNLLGKTLNIIKNVNVLKESLSFKILQ